MAKRDRSEKFRARLLEAMELADCSRSALAREIGVDRSTIGQILKGDLPRMPSAQLAADAAMFLGVSSDWLLGLSDKPEQPGDIIASAMALSPAERSSADEQLLVWHKQAAGYKVRHVPATLPDFLKIEAFMRWEYQSVSSEMLEQSINAMGTHFEWLMSAESDYEIALPIHELNACASNSGYYSELDHQTKLAQLQFIAEQCEQMYPKLRLFLYDAKQVFSAPVTVFGPALAVIYVGQCYLTLSEKQRIRALTDHFDWLIRSAVVDAKDAPSYIRSLI